MSSARRAYDLVRGYVNREFDRLSNVGKSPEEQELDDALSYPAQTAPTTPRQVSLSPEEERAHACRILGLEPTAPFQEIRKAYETLNQRSDPNRFPEASEERSQAMTIQRRIQWAYRKMTENLDTTEMRFRTLEIE